MKAFRGTPFELYVNADPESEHLMGILENTLVNTSGWIEQRAGGSAVMFGNAGMIADSGLNIIAFSDTGLTSAKDLAAALAAEGISAQAARDPKTQGRAIHIRVGKNP